MATGKATNQTTVYYGPSTSTYPSGGRVGPNETVTLLWKEGTYYYIEYNTGAKKKRMYIKKSAISNVSGSIPTYTPILKTRYVHTASSVYCGSSSRTYEKAGSVNLAEEVQFLYNKKENNYALIQYTAGSKKKRAWIKADYLGTAPISLKIIADPISPTKNFVDSDGHKDYAVPKGTKVYAMCDGTFHFSYTWGKKNATSDNSYLSLGRGQKLVPEPGWKTVSGKSISHIEYGHLSKLNGYSTPNYIERCKNSEHGTNYSQETVNLGSKSVKCGDLIGYSGNSGNTYGNTGQHLHVKLC